MSDQKQIKEYLSELEDLHDQARESEALSEKVSHARKAIEVYSDFRKTYSQDDFKMGVLVQGKGGKVEEKEFDWKALDSSN